MASTVTGAFTDNTSLTVNKYNNTLKRAIAKYDITLQDNNTTVQPESTIDISIPSDNANCSVVWIKDESNIVIFDSVDMDKNGMLNILDVTALQNIIVNAE